jgi:hypothetical protein
MLSISSLILMLLGVYNNPPCSAQTLEKIDENHTIHSLYGDEYIITIMGKEQRTITADHARDIEKKEIELDSIKQQNSILQQQVDNLKGQVELYKKAESISIQQIALKEEMNNQFRLIIKGQADLLKETRKLQPGGARAFLDRWYVQTFTKIVIPGIGLGWQVTHQH